MVNKFLLSGKNLFTFLNANHGMRSYTKKYFLSFLRSGTIMVAKIGMYHTCYCALFHQQVPLYQCHCTGNSLQNTYCNGCSICWWGSTSSTWPADEWLSNSAFQNDFHQNFSSIFCSPVFVFLGRVEHFSFLNYEPKIVSWLVSKLGDQTLNYVV